MKKLKKILYIVFVICMQINLVFADEISQDVKIRAEIAAHKQRLPDEYRIAFEYFKNIVEIGENFSNLSMGWSYFDDNNTNLIIGSSGVVFCGNYLGNDNLSKFGYDLVGYGGIFEEDVCELLKRINKKYKKIILFGGVNDLNIRAISGFEHIDVAYFEALCNFMQEAQNHLLDDESRIIYVRIKPMVYMRDGSDEEFINKYNSIAKEVNNIVEVFGYWPYDIPFETTADYSDCYIHFNNKIVYENMLNTVNGFG